MNLCTFVVEFRGGTYILQVMALDETRAVDAWGVSMIRKAIIAAPGAIGKNEEPPG
jgi:hypothetical protein